MVVPPAIVKANSQNNGKEANWQILTSWSSETLERISMKPRIYNYIFKLTAQNIKTSYYPNYCTDFNQILHSHKDHQILFVGGPNTHAINLRWRTAAIFKKSKIGRIIAMV